MKEQCKFKESCAFKNNIAEITSISLECNYEVNGEIINGTFLIEGSYRTHELSINQDNYSFKLPFEYHLPDNCISESVNLNVSDFTYTTDENNLNIEIEYDITYEAKQDITTKEEFDRFLEEHEVEIVDLNEEETKEEKEDESDEEKINDYMEDELIIPEEEIFAVDRNNVASSDDDREENKEDIIINNNSHNIEKTNVTNTIIDNISERDNEYITYHVYICTEYDTLNSIADKFKVSVDILKGYNNVENITTGMKVIIPASQDEN